MKPLTLRPPSSVRRISVLEVVTRRGDGLDDPVRTVTQYWSDTGELLAENDPQRDVLRGALRDMLCVLDGSPLAALVDLDRIRILAAEP